MRTATVTVGVALALLGAAPLRADEKSGLDGEGFVQRWLVLAPIPLGADESAADAVDKEQLKGEANLKPKANDKVKVGDKELTWKEHTCPEHLVDFNAILGNLTEDSVGYAVAYVVAPKRIENVKMKTGSDDQCKVYLNGKEVFKYREERPADKDQDTSAVTLKKGVNVLVFKVVNAKVDWSCCVRFTDNNDKPLTDLTAKTSE